MGDIGDKFPALLLRLLQGIGHGVEGLCQLAHLVVSSGGGVDADVKISPGKAPG